MINILTKKLDKKLRRVIKLRKKNDKAVSKLWSHVEEASKFLERSRKKNMKIYSDDARFFKRLSNKKRRPLRNSLRVNYDAKISQNKKNNWISFGGDDSSMKLKENNNLRDRSRIGGRMKKKKVKNLKKKRRKKIRKKKVRKIKTKKNSVVVVPSLADDIRKEIRKMDIKIRDSRCSRTPSIKMTSPRRTPQSMTGRRSYSYTEKKNEEFRTKKYYQNLLLSGRNLIEAENDFDWIKPVEEIDYGKV